MNFSKQLNFPPISTVQGSHSTHYSLSLSGISSRFLTFSKKAVEHVAQTGRICVLDVDKQGVKSIRNSDLRALFIYISPPSYEILEKRLRDRKTDTESAIEKRLKESKESMEFSKQPGVYDHIILNDKLDVAYNDLKNVLHKVRHMSHRRYSSTLILFQDIECALKQQNKSS